MSTVSLDEFLKPLSHALGRESVPDSIEPIDTINTINGTQRQVLADLTPDELVEKYKKEAAAMGTHVLEAAPADVAEKIAELISLFEGKDVIYPDLPQVDEYGIADALHTAGMNGHRWDPSSRATSVDIAERADAGISFATKGIAETSTIVQECTSKSGRAICLLPITHVAVLKKSDIVPRMTQAMDMLEERVTAGEDLPSNITLISGPSNTADIELVRVVGVHGPVNAGIVLVDE